jgi:hypothetical protein
MPDRSGSSLPLQFEAIIVYQSFGTQSTNRLEIPIQSVNSHPLPFGWLAGASGAVPLALVHSSGLGASASGFVPAGVLTHVATIGEIESLSSQFAGERSCTGSDPCFPFASTRGERLIVLSVLLRNDMMSSRRMEECDDDQERNVPS